MSKKKKEKVLMEVVLKAGKIAVRANPAMLPKDATSLCALIASVVSSLGQGYEKEKSDIVKL